MGFARDLLGYELIINLPDGTVCDYQARICLAVRDHSKVAVRSGHKLGKSLVAVILAIWWVCTRVDARVVMTAATDRQIKLVLWRELRGVYRRLKKTGRIILAQPAKDPATGVQFNDGREVIGFSTKIPENAAGFSGPAMLFILDEGSGIPTEIYEAFAGNMAGGAKMLALSNPTQTSGWFYEAFNERREFWFTMHLSYEDSPNYRAGRVVVPGLMTRQYVEETIAAYGKGSAFYDVRCAGKFPRHIPNAVVGLGLIEAALQRWGDVEPDFTTLDLGVDVARFGDDDSAITPRRGLVAYKTRTVNGFDTIQVAGLVKETLQELRGAGERVRIKVDTIGYGAGVYDQLLAMNDEGMLGPHVEVIAVNVSEVSNEPDEYDLLRDELWFGVRQWLLEGGTFQHNSELEAELVAPTYKFTRKGTIKVESKDELKKRLPRGRSPDRADSLCLAIYEGRTAEFLDPEDIPGAQESRWASAPGRGY